MKQAVEFVIFLIECDTVISFIIVLKMFSPFGGGNLSQYEITKTTNELIGTYGYVTKGKQIQTNRPVAVKKILRQMGEEGFAPNSIREISLLREFHHPNIIE